MMMGCDYGNLAVFFFGIYSFRTDFDETFFKCQNCGVAIFYELKHDLYSN